MRTWLAAGLVALLIGGSSPQVNAATRVPKPHASAPVGFAAKKKAFIDTLMAKMTLEEKIGQMNLLSIGFDVTGPVVSQGVEDKIKSGLVGGVFNTYTPNAVRKLQDIAVKQSRLHIPLIFGFDVIHGHRTIFPINLGLSCSWDPELIRRTAQAAAAEASSDGLNWTFSPMVDISRDPRWGRCSEGAGEDPLLGSRIAQAYVDGYQGQLTLTGGSKYNVLACAKHFALYGAAEAGRDYNTVDMSPVKMFNDYLPPYEAAVDRGVASVMTSFNEINGVPATANKWLITDVLRKMWGFKGFVCTDYTAVSEMVAHGVGDERKVAELAMNAGVDQDMVSELFVKYGPSLVKSGKVPLSMVDAACRRVLEAKYELGLFDDPYRFISEQRVKEEMMSPDKLALSEEAAEKSFVLLKNEKQLLPLNPKTKIAFIGPLVKDQRNLIGSWSGAGDWHKANSIWQVLTAKYGADNFVYARGCNLLEDSDLIKRLTKDGPEIETDAQSPAQMTQEALKVAANADVIVMVMGEPCSMSGEAASRSSIDLPENQVQLLKALRQLDKPIVLVMMNGRPLTISFEAEGMDAILETWYGGTRAAEAIVSTLFGNSNPSGRLTMTWPRNVGQIPIYYNAKNTGRPFDEKEKYRSKYLDVANSPQYPFGYGLSYTTFSYGKVALSSKTLKDTGSIEVTTTVKNTGKYPGVETVQLYTHDLVRSITPPVRELKAFQRVVLAPGEEKRVAFQITMDDLRFYNQHLDFIAEPGEFDVFCGGDSTTTNSARFSLAP